MDFNLDDPLNDLLSDDNDSFFDEPIKKRDSLTRKPAEKKTINDLFNIGNEETKEKPIDDWLGLEENKSPTKSKKISFNNENVEVTKKTPIQKKISFENNDETHKKEQEEKRQKPKRLDEDDDIFSSLGLNKRLQQEEEKPKKTDLLDTILGSSKSEERRDKKITFDSFLKETKLQKTEAQLKRSDSQQSILKRSDSQPSITKQDSQQSLTSENPIREGRRGRKLSTTGLNDPLGLFLNDAKDSTKREEEIAVKPVHSTPNLSQLTLPDWLDGVQVKANKSEEILTRKIDSQQEQEEMPKLLLTQQKLAESNLEYQNTAVTLQQQETQLLMTLQLKKYEEKMMEIQNKQQEILMKQEQQFNSLLEKQFTKQQIMENNMRLQQERINNHIQLLINQPLMSANFKESKERFHNKENDKNENVIESLKQKQQEEMFLLEESYKKQILLMEQSFEAIENRLKIDIDKLTQTFEEKISKINEENNEEIRKYKQKIIDINREHEEDIKIIKENHLKLINEIRNEQNILIDNLKETKKSEMSLFSESNLYLQKLDSNIEILYNNSKTLEGIKDNIEKEHGIMIKVKEENLKGKEQEIILMRSTLEKCRQSAEEERTQLFQLIRNLETKIAEQNQNAREERWALQQAASTLAARSAALDREVEFNRNCLERERAEIKTMKEQLRAEQEQIMLQLTEEKLSISAEKSKLETSRKLNKSVDNAQKAQIEIDTAIQIAKEATLLTDKERELLYKKQIELETHQRSLCDKERRLLLKEREMDDILKETERKSSESEVAMQEAKKLERQFNERLKLLHSQIKSLAEREKKLAEDKINISKERLILHNNLRQVKMCGLCAVDAPKINDFDVDFPDFSTINPDNIHLQFRENDIGADDHEVF